MNRSFMMRLAGYMALSLSVVTPVLADGTLGIGDQAPELKVAQWVKGDTVKGFESGKIYVIEFWATWCGPCKTSIPHITELAQKYNGKVSFTGVSVWEEKKDDKDTSYFKTVTDFVKSMDKKMDYNVAIDGPDDFMSNAWMKASGAQGIPTAFIVKDKMIAWIGHPMEMGNPLADIVAGKYDMEAAKNKAMNAKAAEKETEALFKPIQDAMEKKDHAGVVKAVDNAIAKRPEMERNLGMVKWQALMNVDGTKGMAYGKKLAEGPYAKDGNALNSMAWMMLDEKSGVPNGDPKEAVKLAEKALELNKSNPMLHCYTLDTLAYGHYKCGDVKKALELQKQAMALLGKIEEVDEATKSEMKERFDLYTKEAK